MLKLCQHQLIRKSNMCLLFIFTNPSAKDGEYSLILVNNRDEFFTRPTKPLHKWASGIYAGMDAMPDREGGTWLGIIDKGRIGCLLNILKPVSEFKDLKEVQGRGYLVTDFLNGSKGSLGYLNDLANSQAIYNDFRLVTLEKYCGEVKALHYNNSDRNVVTLPHGIYAFGNSYPSTSFKKMERGKKLFEDVIGKYGSVKQESELVSSLFSMMKDKENTHPDPELIKQSGGHHPEMVNEMGNIFVCGKEANYGTRTTSIITVESNGKTRVIESTMKEPIDVDNAVWETRNFEFHLNCCMECKCKNLA
ncbi:transport and golgi organization 2 isoform X2 [Oratosquilla oratoria]|uniref:transport and golgi organization 2 isoform X2 n=1 Tax=Oratosquilla oratoria TaxID=337810 RepID=UPI003F759EC3